jgi:hypothetical protein
VSDEQRRWTDGSLPSGNSDKATTREVFALVNALRDDTARARHEQTNRLTAAMAQMEARLEDRLDRLETRIDAKWRDQTEEQHELREDVDTVKVRVAVAAAVVSLLVFVVNLAAPAVLRMLAP